MGPKERLEAMQARHKQAAIAKLQAEQERKAGQLRLAEAHRERIKVAAPDLWQWLVELKEAGLEPQMPRVEWANSTHGERGDEIGPKTYVWVGW